MSGAIMKILPMIMQGMSTASQMQKTGSQSQPILRPPSTQGGSQNVPPSTQQGRITTPKADFSQMPGRALTTSQGQPVIPRKSGGQATGQEMDSLLKLLQMLQGIQR